MLTKVCTRCGARYTGRTCPQCEAKRQKQYDEFGRNKESQALYHSKEWRWLAGECKEQCAGLDLFQFYEHGRIVMGRLAHHIVPVIDNRKRQYDLSNLIWLSDASHAAIHRAYESSPEDKIKMQKKLFSFLKKFRKTGRGGEVKKVFPV